jgi:hypothetical protein
MLEWFYIDKGYIMFTPELGDKLVGYTSLIIFGFLLAMYVL